MTAADGGTRQTPTAEDVAQATAYMTGAMYGFGILFEHWTGWHDGTATSLDGEGTRLIYTGGEAHPFDAVIPCARHTRHRVGVTWPHELDQARTDTAACSAKAPAPEPAPAPSTAPAPVAAADPPTVALRPVTTPTPLWLITHAADTPGKDRHQSAS
ncbi:hypothetical protein ACFVJK_48930 [Streptomyces sp. NPDC127172]|uniref:hypothetical protein n=1 Tax=Streptomyces sp. NPDC127172 TaxID=3345382 RepID=UPI00364252C5